MEAGKVYSLKSVILTVQGVPILGGLHEDAITLEPEANLFEPTTGPDGHTVYNRTNNDNWLMTVTVMETSRAYKLLDDILTASLAMAQVPGAPAVMTVSVRDLLSGESLMAASGVILRRPDRSKGAMAGGRAFQFHLTNPQLGSASINLVR